MGMSLASSSSSSSSPPSSSSLSSSNRLLCILLFITRSIPSSSSSIATTQKSSSSSSPPPSIPPTWLPLSRDILEMPQFLRSGPAELQYDLKEESQIGILVADLLRDTNIQEQLTNVNNNNNNSNSQYEDANINAVQRLRFRYLTQPGCPLALDERRGLITVGGRVDREVLCGREELCQLRLDVAVQPMFAFRIFKITINLIDINDHQPLFDPDHVSISLLETSTVGTSVLLDGAKDLDSSKFSVIGYTVVSEEITVLLKTKQDSASSRQHKQYQQQSRRQHKQQQHHFKAELHRKLDGTVNLRLVLTRPLDRETASHHKLAVVAYDGGRPSLSSTLLIDVKVEDANDNPPVFERDTYEVNLREDLNLGHEVIRLKASDADAEDNDNSKIHFYFSDSTVQKHGRIFSVGERSGHISLSGKLDRELVKLHRLVVMARDQGQPPLSSEAVVMVTVDDVNDNKPQIKIQTLEKENAAVAMVTENANIGSFVAHVVVSDGDADEFGRVERCSVTSDLANRGSLREGSTPMNYQQNYNKLIDQPFSIRRTSENGFQIETNKILDREIISSYSVQITCQDIGRPPLSSSLSFSVNVVDENDNQPSFERVRHDIKIFENSQIGSTILRLKASDPDEGLNSAIKYSVVKEEKFPTNWTLDPAQFKVQQGDKDGASNHFQVDAISGDLKNVYSLDRERVKAYIVVAKAEDGGSPTRSSTTQIFIEVADENDEPPRLVPGSEILSVPENTKPSLIIGVVKFLDPDLPPFNRFTIRLLGETGYHDYNEQQQPQQNKLTLQQQQFSIWQTAFKPSHPPQSTLQLRLRHNNNNNVNNDVNNFRTAESNGMFSIDPKTGEVKVHAMLDREEKATHLLSVVVIDDHNPQLVTTATITIHVKDVNDNAPVFVQPLHTDYSLYLPNSAPSGHVITSVKAIDLDADANSFVSYTLEGPWRILRDDDDDNDAGGDGGEGGGRSRPFVTNEATLEIIKRKLSEDNGSTSSQGRTRFRNRQDLDLEFVMESTDESLFTIVNQSDGNKVLILAKEMKANDRTNKQIFYLQLKATDHGSPPLQSTLHLLISVNQSAYDLQLKISSLSSFDSASLDGFDQSAFQDSKRKSAGGGTKWGGLLLVSIICACASIMFVTLVIALVVVLYKRFGKSHRHVIQGGRSLNNSTIIDKNGKNVDFHRHQPYAPYDVYPAKFQQPPPPPPPTQPPPTHKNIHLKEFPMKELESKEETPYLVASLYDRDFNFHSFGDNRSKTTTTTTTTTTSATTKCSLINFRTSSNAMKAQTQGGYATIEYRQHICRPSPETPATSRSRGFGSKVGVPLISQSTVAFSPGRDNDIPPVQPDILSCSPGRKKAERPPTFRLKENF